MERQGVDLGDDSSDEAALMWEVLDGQEEA